MPSQFADQLKVYLSDVNDRRLQQAPASREPSDRRAAVRVTNVDRARVIIDGADVSLVDLSVTGAQLLSPALLAPGELVPVVLRNHRDAIECQAAVVWGAFEVLPSSRLPQYRAGVDWRDADRRFLEKLCSGRVDEPTSCEVPSSFGRVLFSRF
jgi:hypothetical protein